MHSDDIKQYTRIKKKFALRFATTEKTVQRAFDQILDYAEANGNALTPEQIIAFGTPSDSILYDVFASVSTDEEKRAIAIDILDNVKYFVSSSGKLYAVTPDVGEG